MCRLVGVVGSRLLPASFSPLVSSVVSFFLGQGFRVASGGALGADLFVLSALLQLHGACPERMVSECSESNQSRRVSILSPCLQCGHILPGVKCCPHNRARCARFLDYIQQLHRSRAHHILIKELKDLIIKSIN